MSDKSSVLKQIRSSALIKNPLLFEAIGLCPVVAIAHSLKLAVFLAIVTAIEMIVCEVLASKFLKNIRRYWRVALYALLGVAVIFPIMYITDKFYPGLSANFGVYLPLMAVNSLIALHCERVAVKNDVKTSFIDAVSSSLSYGVVAILVGFLRELLGNGTIWGFELNIPIKLPAFLMPFGGLIIMGFLSAGLKSIINKKYPEANPNKAFDTSEIRRSLRGSFKDLMSDDYNPYGDTGDEELTTNRKQKPKKQKKIKNKDVEAKVEEAISTPVEDIESRTYLDDFSEMLSELDENKTKNRTDDNGGGDK